MSEFFPLRMRLIYLWNREIFQLHNQSTFSLNRKILGHKTMILSIQLYKHYYSPLQCSTRRSLCYVWITTLWLTKPHWHACAVAKHCNTVFIDVVVCIDDCSQAIQYRIKEAKSNKMSTNGLKWPIAEKSKFKYK